MDRRSSREIFINRTLSRGLLLAEGDLLYTEDPHEVFNIQKTIQSSAVNRLPARYRL